MRARALRLPSPSVAEVGEGAIRLGHLVGVFLALDRGAHAVGGVHQLGRELVGHAPAAAAAGVADDPPARFGLTSMTGVTLRIAWSNTSSGSLREERRIRSKAS